MADLFYEQAFSLGLIHRFIAHAQQQPEQLALMTQEANFKYDELLFEVVRWKHFFQAQFKPQDRVILALERHAELISIVLALQWLNITYIPVDLNFPTERLMHIIEHSQAHAILIDHTSNWSQQLNLRSCSCIEISNIQLQHPDWILEEELSPPNPQPHDLAYIIYTSGSTGTPKGVCISYRAMHHFLHCMSEHFLLHSDELVLATTTLAFDIAVLELYLPLWKGKTLLLASQKQHKDPFALIELLKLYPITLMQATPSLWKMLNHLEWPGSKQLHALCGGEPLPQTLADQLLTQVASLWNMYGPTEATVWCSLKKIKAHEPITVGQPIAGMKFYVLNEQLEPLAPYEKGELFVSGVGLAEGYLNQPELTLERFFPHPHHPEERLYRVGDIACQTHHNEFIIFGRTDHQIKLHGYRIELEDIECHLEQAPGVQSAAVIAQHEQLIALICLKPLFDFNEASIRAYVHLNLPEYMHPIRYIILDTLPLNHNGKINRQSLHALCQEPRSIQEIEMLPFTETQQTLKELWSKILMIHPIQLHDNFYQLGGHSLVAARLIHEINQHFHTHCSLATLDHYPTVAQMADHLDEAHLRRHNLTHEAFDPLLAQRWNPLNDFQLTFWLSKRFDDRGQDLTVAGRHRFEGSLDEKKLKRALELLMTHHEALRQRLHAFYPAQRTCAKRIQAEYQSTDYSTLQLTDANLRLEHHFEALYHHSPWSKKTTNFVLHYYRLPHGRCELQLGLAHEIADETSLDILWRDLSSAYLTHSIPSQANVLHVLDGWEQQRYLEHQGEQSAQFWREYLIHTGLFECPIAWMPDPSNLSSFRYSSYFNLNEAHLTYFYEFMKTHRVHLNEILSAITAKALVALAPERETSQQKILISSTHSTRHSSDHESTVGCFLKTITLPLDLQFSKNLIQLIQQAHQSFLETTQHQAAPTLVKLGALGGVKKIHRPLITALVKTCFRALKPIAKRFYLPPFILDALLHLMNIQRDRSFFVGINILPSFLASASPKHPSLFEKNILLYPEHHYDMTRIPQVLDVCFDRDPNKHQPRMIISVNMHAEIRDLLGKTILQIIEQELAPHAEIPSSEPLLTHNYDSIKTL